MTRVLLASLLLISTLGLAACSEDVTAPANTAASSSDAQGFAADTAFETELKPGGSTIDEIADAEGFTLLLAAVEYIAETNPESGLVAGLLDRDQYTVFAPTDDAFLALVGAVEADLDPEVLENDGPFAAIDDLLGPGTIEAVVSYHVTEGRRSSKSVLPRNRDRTIQTLLEDASFSVSSGGMITAVGSTATITLPDQSASNGIIHVIDAVLLPVDLGL